MKAMLTALPLAAAVAATALPAQESSSPTSPPPTTPLVATTPERVVYLPQLPSLDELTTTARAQGLTLASIEESAGEIVVNYRSADATTRTVAYRILPTSADGVAAPAENTIVAPVAPPPPPPVEIIEEVPPPRTTIVYRDHDPFFDDPFYFRRRAPVSLHLGFGWYDSPSFHHHGHRGWSHRPHFRRH